ncbi:MAG: DNA primase [Rhodospirillales bacterium]
MAFTPDFLDELRSRLTLSEIVGRRVALKKKGRSEFSGLCPFHNEKTPSFTVNDQKSFFHCFGCGAHGDAVGFVMRSEGLPFPEAVERLAREAGLALPVSSPQERERAQQAATLQDAVEKAALWFERNLWSPDGAAALAYLRRRGLSDETIRNFRLGFAPDRRDGLRQALMSNALPEGLLVESGLLIQPDEGRTTYDRFRGRVMFPIQDRRGHVVAFGGRILGEGEPKYLNSPETPLFHKGEMLFAYSRARGAVHDGATAIVAEGYMDVIALHQAGFTGAVAPLGTALTEGQLGLLWRIADEPALCFDGDNAGARAALRAADRALPMLKPGKSLRFVALPAGEDPDTLIQGRGADAFRALLASAEPLAEIVWRQETINKPADTPERRASIETTLMKRVASIADPTVQQYYRREWRDRLWRSFTPPRPMLPNRLGSSTRYNKDWGRGGGMGANRYRPDLRERGPLTTLMPNRLEAGDPLVGERNLLAALVRRPTLIPLVAEELAHVLLQDRRHEALRAAMLGWATGTVAGSLGSDSVQGMADNGENHDEAIEKGAFLAHLADLALLAVAQEVLGATAASVGDQPALAAQAGQWRYAASLHNAEIGRGAMLAEAVKAYEESPTDENWIRLQALIDQVSPVPPVG